MQQTDYTPEQKADIKARSDKAIAMLKELHLIPSAVVHKVNTGDDIFADKVIPYLQDTKYAAIPSPIQKDELEKKG